MKTFFSSPIMPSLLGAALAITAWPAAAQSETESPGASPTEQTVTITFRRAEGGSKWSRVDTTQGIPLVPIEVAGVPSCAILDTAGDKTIVDLDLARRAGLEMADTAFEAKVNGKIQPEVKRARNVPVHVPGQFEFRADLPVTTLPEMPCAGGGRAGVIFGTEFLNLLAFAIDPKSGRIAFSSSGGMNPTGDRWIKLAWKDGIVVGTIDLEPLFLEVSTTSAGSAYVEPQAFARVFPGRAPEPLATEGGGLLSGVPFAKLTLGGMSVEVPVVRRAEDDDGKADGRVGFLIFRPFMTIFDRGANRIMLRIPDLPGSENNAEVTP